VLEAAASMPPEDLPVPFTDTEIDRFLRSTPDLEASVGLTTEQLELEEQRRIGYELNAAYAPDERAS
jgi:hypothetical protein